jgi:uncharacterized protein YecE (DUF72 family)
MSSKFRIGTSGWVYRHWHGIFYPQDLRQPDWYQYYASHFDTVEINYSFYRLPSKSAFEKWRQQAPKGFVYAVKANRYLTHMKRLKDVADPLERFLSHASLLEDKLGPILWQLPPKWRADPARLKAFAKLLPDDMIHAFEFRDPGWFIQPVRKILEQFGLTHCIFDMPNIRCPKWITSPTIYLRFHGSQYVYGGRYGREGLQPWADRVNRWLADGHMIYAYFNNDVLGYAIEDARTLKSLLTE